MVDMIVVYPEWKGQYWIQKLSAKIVERLEFPANCLLSPPHHQMDKRFRSGKRLCSGQEVVKWENPVKANITSKGLSADSASLVMGSSKTTTHKQQTCNHVLSTFGLELMCGLNMQGGRLTNKKAFERTALYDIMTGRSSSTVYLI